jgi:hypothetical protein
MEIVLTLESGQQFNQSSAERREGKGCNPESRLNRES